jgi:hypothetical protein
LSLKRLDDFTHPYLRWFQVRAIASLQAGPQIEKPFGKAKGLNRKGFRDLSLLCLKRLEDLANPYY